MQRESDASTPTTGRPSGNYFRRCPRLTEAPLRAVSHPEGFADGQAVNTELKEPSMSVTIELEQPNDASAIELLLDEAFGVNRHNKQSYRYRRLSAPVAGLCLVAREGDRLVATVRQWPVTIVGDRRMTPALLLGPIGVAADRRSLRIGDRLMRESLRQALELGYG